LAELVEIGPDDVLGPARGGIRALWLEVWPTATPERLDEIFLRHAARDGFRMIAAREGDRLVGLAYGYLGGPGEWWHDRVSAAMTPEQRAEWLPPGHFELVELMVSPAERRRGLGGRLHDALLMGLEAPTAVLSTQQHNDPALALYSRRGWKLLLEAVDLAAPVPYVVLGKRLHSASAGQGRRPE
jgi:ribosomal protein S18 acetylase RimI-like enzyme